MLKIQHAVDLYHAENDRYPKDYDEFMTEIIKANNIALPKLPALSGYGYDEKEHKLIILEYPDRKNQPRNSWSQSLKSGVGTFPEARLQLAGDSSSVDARSTRKRLVVSSVLTHRYVPADWAPRMPARRGPGNRLSWGRGT